MGDKVLDVPAYLPYAASNLIKLPMLEKKKKFHPFGFFIVHGDPSSLKYSI
jgi:hypothetical protein